MICFKKLTKRSSIIFCLVEELCEFLKEALSLLLLHLLLVNKIILSTNQPPCSVLKGNARERELLLQHQRLATVCADNHLGLLIGEGQGQEEIEG